MKIHVTSDHIKRGKTVNALECPVALALRSAANLAIKPTAAVYVHRKGIHIDGRVYKVPDEVVKFLDMFDEDYRKNKSHQPFTFDLE